MFIDGLALAGYRSFGETVQRIGPFQKINLFAGPNNSGKSNILRFLTKHLRQLAETNVGQAPGDHGFSDLDRHLGSGAGTFVFGLARRKDGKQFDAFRNRFQPRNRDSFDQLLSAKNLSHGTDCVWLEGVSSTLGGRLDPASDIAAALAEEIKVPKHEWWMLYHSLFPQSSGGTRVEWIHRIRLEFLSATDIRVPAVDLVPSIRRIGDKGLTPSDLSGAGIINRLAQLEHPSHAEQKKKEQFEQINRFLRKVAGNRSAALEIPYERDTILVHMDGKVLPLESLGTGIHEVIILAAAATILQDQIVCMEEPELHLHPVLQRKLVQYLNEHTSNQYFIATHSSHLLDAEDVAVFHVQLVDGETVVTPARDAVEKFNICVDLGCRASDLMQSNCVVWVEGPSDRIYLNHWIRALDRDFVEGTHYSIMFYGGRLLSHLSANDPEVDDFISLRRLNRNLVIVMDSDRNKARAQMNATKERVCSEFPTARGFAWVTEGREIENYVAPQILREAVEAVRPGLAERLRTGKFQRVLTNVGAKAEKGRQVDKVKVAHEVANRPPDLSVLDLKTQIERLVQFIHEANVA